MLKPTGGWGYHSDTEILFPMRVAPVLESLRGDVWRRVVDRASRAVEGSVDQLAFSLLMIRLDGCLTCHTDCYRAMRGCSLCATLAVRRFRGTDDELAAMYEAARIEIGDYLEYDRHESSTVAG